MPRYVVFSVALLILWGCSTPKPFPQIDFKRYETKYFEVEIHSGRIQVAFVGGLPGQSVLEWPLDGTMLEGMTSVREVAFDKGSFEIKERRARTCPTERIERIESNSKRVVIYGWICGETPFELTLEAEKPGELNVQVELKNGERLNGLAMEWLSEEGEGFFGLGPQFSHVQLKGHRVPIWVEERGNGAGGEAFTSPAPMPGFLSTKNRYFWLNGRSRMVVDFNDPARVRVETWARRLGFTVWQSPTPLELLEQVSAKVGRVGPMPEWAFGAILGVQGGRERVLGILDSLEQADCPVRAIWIQDWCGKRETSFGSQLMWNWQSDGIRYPDLRGFIEELGERGIAVLGYVNPFLTKDTKDAISKDKDGVLPKGKDAIFFSEAEKEGYFVKNYLGQSYPITATGFDAYLIDLTNPEAFNWFKNILKKELIDIGFAGWMADYGEWLPNDALLYSGADALTYHNQYPVDWARLNREAIREAGKEGEMAFFSRSAHTLSSFYTPFYWLGDQLVDWGDNDGLAAVLHGLVSSGFSGIAVNHSDVGGFTAIKRTPLHIVREEELLKRWIELGAFSPVFRTHEGLCPKLNVQVYDTQELRAFYARFAREHKKLKPYLEKCLSEAREKGYPMVRHLYLHYPNDPNVPGLDEEYLLGPDLLVAPVVREKQEEVDVYLPEGSWRHYWSKELFAGGRWYKVKAPLGEPAVFWKSSSLQ
ncbi:MAG: alpha-glucosidase [Saprospirales bacterium]|nr:alpha-glucosidase [Saprospirales bacterium]